MQALDTLRVYTNVPEVYTKGIERGEKIALCFPAVSGQDIRRNAGAHRRRHRPG